MKQRRLTFEILDPHIVNLYEFTYGKSYWPKFDWSEFKENQWHKTVVVFNENERMDQYETLKNWAETRTQPIRNVTLEEREVIGDEEGWKKVKDD